MELMLQQIAPDIWHLPHHFTASGVRFSSRMTVVRFGDKRLWLHSPVPVSPQVRAQLGELGTVAFIVAPNKTHHLYVADCAAAFPDAAVFGAPGLIDKRPDLGGFRVLERTPEPAWQGELGQLFIEGIPFLNETVWYHRKSRTLILTDLCQWWQGELPFSTRLFATLTGSRKRLAVPLPVRLSIKDRAALGRSIDRICDWDIERVVIAHNAIVEGDAPGALRQAFADVL
jgi:hypothetical protein